MLNLKELSPDSWLVQTFTDKVFLLQKQQVLGVFSRRCCVSGPLWGYGYFQTVREPQEVFSHATIQSRTLEFCRGRAVNAAPGRPSFPQWPQWEIVELALWKASSIFDPKYSVKLQFLPPRQRQRTAAWPHLMHGAKVKVRNNKKQDMRVVLLLKTAHSAQKQQFTLQNKMLEPTRVKSGPLDRLFLMKRFIF